MDSLNDTETIIDAEFTEVNSDLFNNENINGKPLYYNCKQVAQIIDEVESTVRYWAKSFEPILNLEVSNMTRKYTKTNIENLLFIKKLLKVDGMTIKQTLDYCSNKGFNSKEGLIDTGNPLAIKTFTEAMTVEIDKKFDKMQEEIIKQQQIMIDNLSKVIIERNINLNNSLCKTVDVVVSDKMDGYFDSIQEELAITKETDKRVVMLIESMKNGDYNVKKKGLFSRLFKK